MPSSQVKQDWLLSHGSRWLHRLPFMNQGEQKVVQNQLRQTPVESGVILYACPDWIKRKGHRDVLPYWGGPLG
jgi:hypothetical protein